MKRWMLIFLVGLLSCLFAGLVQAQAAYVVAVGDSLTEGDGDDGSGGGYPARLQTLLNTPYPGTTMNNMAISGDTTTDLVTKQLDGAVAALNAAPAGTLKIALVWIGSNDLFGLYASTTCQEYYGGDMDRCEATEMGFSTDNVDTILGDLAATGADIYLALLDDQSRRPVITDPTLRADTFPGFTADEIPRMSTQVGNYNSAVQTLAATHGATTVDFYNTTIFENWATLSDDGNHPNGSGYDAIAAIWDQAITGGGGGGATYDLTVAKDGDGTGTVTSVGSSAIDCGSDCAETYTEDTAVTLQAAAASGSLFAGWSGACSGTGDCALVMSANRSVTATFTVEGSSLATLSGSCGSGAVTVTLSNRRVASDTRYSCSASQSITTTGEFLIENRGDVSLTAPEIRFQPNFQSALGSTLVARAGTVSPPVDADLMQTTDFQYLGAFRLPGEAERPQTFEYGGNAMTFNPDGDPSGPADGFPGSLFISGHDRIAYNDLPDGGQIAEVSIPVPISSGNLATLNTGGFLQGFANVFDGWFTDREEIPRMGLEYLNHTVTGPKVHATWGSHQQETAEHGYTWFEADLSNPQIEGPWNLGTLNRYRLSGYIFEIPGYWADQHTTGRYLGTGRFRDGAWSGMGPNLIAYRPWVDAAGTPAAADAQLAQTTLLAYEDSYTTSDVTYHSLDNYQHADEWESGAWITTTTGKEAVLFAGTKGTGDKYWYGYASIDGAGGPCVSPSDPRCYLADGSSCPPADLAECHGTSDRGFWSSRFDAWLILYDPDDLASVAAGTMESWEPQPYAHIDIDQHLFMNPDNIDIATLGEGDQRRFRIGATAYDRANDLLYVLELYADGAKPVVHVWRVQ